MSPLASNKGHIELKTFELEFKTETAFRELEQKAMTLPQAIVLTLTPHNLLRYPGSAASRRLHYHDG